MGRQETSTVVSLVVLTGPEERLAQEEIRR